MAAYPPNNPGNPEEEMPMPGEAAMPGEPPRPTLDELDELLGQADQMEADADEAAAAEGAEGGEEGAEEGAESEAAPIMKALDISQERAEDLLAAAKQMDKTKDMDANTLAEALAKDFQLRMELEKLAAQMTGGDEDEAMAEDAMMEEGMMPPTAGPPMGGPPMGGPPMGPGGPMGGM